VKGVQGGCWGVRGACPPGSATALLVLAHGRCTARRTEGTKEPRVHRTKKQRGQGSGGPKDHENLNFAKYTTHPQQIFLDEIHHR